MSTTLYNAIGYLSEALFHLSNEIKVDSDLENILRNNLTTGWTYLKINDNCNVEIVKLSVGVDKKLHILRGQDNTTPHSFVEGSNIEYTLTVSEIRESVESANLDIYYGGGLSINKDIQYVFPEIKGLGGVRVTRHDNSIVLDREIGLFGCCDADNPGAPPVPPPVTYFTTQLYPAEALDKSQFQSQYRYDIEKGIPPVPIEPWLLVQPSVVEPQYVENISTTITSMKVYGGIVKYNTTEPQYVENISTTITSMKVYGGAIELNDIVEPQYVENVSTIITTMNIYGGAINYNTTEPQYVENISTTITSMKVY